MNPNPKPKARAQRKPRTKPAPSPAQPPAVPPDLPEEDEDATGPAAGLPAVLDAAEVLREIRAEILASLRPPASMLQHISAHTFAYCRVYATTGSPTQAYSAAGLPPQEGKTNTSGPLNSARARALVAWYREQIALLESSPVERIKSLAWGLFYEAKQKVTATDRGGIKRETFRDAPLAGKMLDLLARLEGAGQLINVHHTHSIPGLLEAIAQRGKPSLEAKRAALAPPVDVQPIE